MCTKGYYTCMAHVQYMQPVTFRVICSCYITLITLQEKAYTSLHLFRVIFQSLRRLH